MGLFIFIGTISKILNRRIEKKIVHLHQETKLEEDRKASIFLEGSLSLLSVKDSHDTLKETDINETSFDARAASSH